MLQVGAVGFGRGNREGEQGVGQLGLGMGQVGAWGVGAGCPVCGLSSETVSDCFGSQSGLF